VKSCFSCWLVVFDKIAELPSIEKKGEICTNVRDFLPSISLGTSLYQFLDLLVYSIM